MTERLLYMLAVCWHYVLVLLPEPDRQELFNQDWYLTACNILFVQGKVLPLQEKLYAFRTTQAKEESKALEQFELALRILDIEMGYGRRLRALTGLFVTLYLLRYPDRTWQEAMQWLPFYLPT